MRTGFSVALLMATAICAMAQAQNADTGAGTTSIGQANSVSSVVVLEQKSVRRGEILTARIPTAAESQNVQVQLLGTEVRSVNPSWQGGVLTVPVPEDLALGRYHLGIHIDGKSYPSSKFPVLAWDVEPTLDRVQALERDRTEGKVSLRLFGNGFSTQVGQHPGDINLLIDGSQQKVEWNANGSADEARAACAGDKVLRGAVVSPFEIYLCNVAVAHDGKLPVNLVQGTRLASQEAVITNWDAWKVRLTAFVVAAFLVGLVYLLVSFKGDHIIRGTRYRFRAMFLDKQTNTYSLSVAQFHLWTASALFGYTYFALAKMLVQRGDIPEVSGGLPAIIAPGLAAVTAVGSQLISSVNSKGSGDEIPSPSDLVTTGGAVAPDRVQMLVWTLIGVGVFLVAVLREQPATMQDLPTIPQSLMALMGLSSVGYLGAKFARKPGPNILELSVIPTAPENAVVGSAPVPTAELAQPSAVAAQALQSVKAVAAGMSESSAPIAVREAATAVAALETALSAVTSIPKSGAADALQKLARCKDAAHHAATNAAAEFDRSSGTAGSEMARTSANIAQRAASAAEELAGSVGSLVATAEHAARQHAEENARSLRRIVEFRGENLSAEGVFRARVEGREYDLPFRMLEERENRRAPEIVVADDQSGNAKFARTLRLTILPANLELADRKTYDAVFGCANGETRKEITFMIFNPDGQKAMKTIALPPGEGQRA